MGKTYPEIDADLQAWIEQQKMFFVATAPTGEEGHINCSPKGLDSFRVLAARQVAYLDLTGSGVETIAHLRQNGRIVFMFCAMNGPPKIVRLHGRGRVVLPDSADWSELSSHFPELPGMRSIIVADLSRISDSCGYGVPKYEYAEDRPTLIDYSEKLGPVGMAEYRAKKNVVSIDELPGVDVDAAATDG